MFVGEYAVADKLSCGVAPDVPLPQVGRAVSAHILNRAGAVGKHFGWWLLLCAEFCE